MSPEKSEGLSPVYEDVQRTTQTIRGMEAVPGVDDTTAVASESRTLIALVFAEAFRELLLTRLHQVIRCETVLVRHDEQVVENIGKFLANMQ